jgi:ectoine hydroxylase-related dioxygenase (phytanoyl-CoA dioxygenase family)
MLAQMLLLVCYLASFSSLVLCQAYKASVIRPPVTALTAANTDQVVVRVKDGTLLVFPSYLYHSVDANTSGDTRVSLSFNLMFPTFGAALSKPLWGDE